MAMRHWCMWRAYVTRYARTRDGALVALWINDEHHAAVIDADDPRPVLRALCPQAFDVRCYEKAAGWMPPQERYPHGVGVA